MDAGGGGLIGSVWPTRVLHFVLLLYKRPSAGDVVKGSRWTFAFTRYLWEPNSEAVSSLNLINFQLIGETIETFRCGTFVGSICHTHKMN